MRATCLLVCLLVGLLLSPATASDETPVGPPFISHGDGPVFVLDYAAFQGSPERTYLEFYFQVTYDELQFIKYRDRFQARYELSLKIFDQQDRLVAEERSRDTFEATNFEEAHSLEKARASQIDLNLPPGQYRLQARLLDFETLHSTYIEQPLAVRSFAKPELCISDVQLSTNIRAGAEGEPYVKNQRFIEPNAIRYFAQELHPYLHLYFEIYNLQTEAGSAYQTEYSFLAADGQPFARLRRSTAKPGSSAAHSLRFKLDHFPEGDYTLVVRVSDPESQASCEARTMFKVLGAPVPVSRTEKTKPLE